MIQGELATWNEVRRKSIYLYCDKKNILGSDLKFESGQLFLKKVVY